MRLIFVKRIGLKFQSWTMSSLENDANSRNESVEPKQLILRSGVLHYLSFVVVIPD